MEEEARRQGRRTPSVPGRRLESKSKEVRQTVDIEVDDVDYGNAIPRTWQKAGAPPERRGGVLYFGWRPCISRFFRFRLDRYVGP